MSVVICGGQFHGKPSLLLWPIEYMHSDLRAQVCSEGVHFVQFISIRIKAAKTVRGDEHLGVYVSPSRTTAYRPNPELLVYNCEHQHP